MTRRSASRGILYSAPPAPAEDEETAAEEDVEASEPTAEGSTETAAADD